MVCEGYGGFLAEVPLGPDLNHWIVDKLLEKDGHPGNNVRVPMGDQYWLGARDHGHHNQHHPGDWVWEHRNTSVQWFDWGSGEPNNFGEQVKRSMQWVLASKIKTSQSMAKHYFYFRTV